MSLNEKSLFLRYLQKAKNYFEFGSGGSTVWAVKQGLVVRGVESDSEWVNCLKTELGEQCQIQFVDIGPISEWGYPHSLNQKEKFPAYSRSIHNNRLPFDLILIDGRFRVASTISAIAHI